MVMVTPICRILQIKQMRRLEKRPAARVLICEMSRVISELLMRQFIDTAAMEMLVKVFLDLLSLFEATLTPLPDFGPKDDCDLLSALLEHEVSCIDVPGASDYAKLQMARLALLVASENEGEGQGQGQGASIQFCALSLMVFTVTMQGAMREDEFTTEIHQALVFWGLLAYRCGLTSETVYQYCMTEIARRNHE